jgi:hypothetical protein
MMNAADLHPTFPFPMANFNWLNNAVREAYRAINFTDAQRYLESSRTKGEMIETIQKLGLSGKTLKDILAFDPDDMINEAVEKIWHDLPIEDTWSDYGSPCDEIAENGWLNIYPGRLGSNAWSYDELEELLFNPNLSYSGEFGFELFLIMIVDNYYEDYFQGMAEEFNWPFSEYHCITPPHEMSRNELQGIKRRLCKAGMEPFWQAMVTTYNLIGNVYFSFQMPWDGEDGDDPYSFCEEDIRFLTKEWKKAEPYNIGRLKADELVEKDPSLIAAFVKVAFGWDAETLSKETPPEEGEEETSPGLPVSGEENMEDEDEND